MVQGVKGSRLLSNLYEGDDRNVPVGQNILTNDASQMHKDLLPLSVGQKLTTLHVDQFDIFGRSRDGKAVKRDPNTDGVTFVNREVVNDGLIIQAAYESNEGVLNMVRRSGEVLTIPGMYTQGDFGVGATGPMGEPGYDGHDGDDGDEGAEGAVGCEGMKGEVGPAGPMGEAGEDGPIGIPGPVGQEGWTGIQGPIGTPGRYGHEGARGRKGAECLAEEGAQGAQGIALNPSVVISKTTPGDTAVIWGAPE